MVVKEVVVEEEEGRRSQVALQGSRRLEFQ